jgi:ubiquinone/menaquinone biosynthesis C-methylase UbiE
MSKDDGLNSLRKQVAGFEVSRLIIAALNLGVFEALSRPRTLKSLTSLIKASARGTELMLNALIGLGYVRKSVKGFQNSSISNRYLVKEKPMYQGDIIRHYEALWNGWSFLEDSIRTGLPAKRDPADGSFGSFIMGMHNLSLKRAPELIKAIGLKGVKTALDLGSGPGTNAMAICKQGVEATVFDLPEAIVIAKKVAGKSRIKGLKYMAGDFTKDSIGKGYDLILISQIFHAYSERVNLKLLRKCKRALNPGGRVAVQEFQSSGDKTRPVHSSLFGLNMLVGTSEGRLYSSLEIKSWLKRAGFKSLKSVSLSETVLITGRQ